MGNFGFFEKNFQMFDRKSIRGIQRRQNGYSDVFCGGKTLQYNISVLLKVFSFLSQRTTLKNFQAEDSFESEARKISIELLNVP